MTTVEAVQSKLGERIPLGYCNSGEVIAVGAGVTDFQGWGPGRIQRSSRRSRLGSDQPGRKDSRQRLAR